MSRRQSRQVVARQQLIAILDNEAVQAAVQPDHSKHRSMMALVSAVSQRNVRRPGQVRLLTSTAVRVEAGIDRRQPTAALLGGLRIRDVVLDSSRADACAELCRGAGGTIVDATVAQAALAERTPGTTVSIYTADVVDLERLVSAGGGVRVRLV